MGLAVILQGLPGSGKSTYAANMYEKLSTVVCTADDYHTVDGVYKYDVENAHAAYVACFNKYMTALDLGCDIVVCANTNTLLLEMSPYVMVAQAFGYEVEIHHFRCSIETSMRRNLHGVPEETILAMAERMETPLERFGDYVVHLAD